MAAARAPAGDGRGFGALQRGTRLLLYGMYGLGGLLFVLAGAGTAGFFGYRTRAVETALLEPLVSRGALLIEAPVAPGELAPGDLVSFSADSNPGAIFTQQLTEVEGRGPAVQLTTLPPGAPQEPRQWLVDAAQPVGRVVLAIPLAGYVYRLADEPLVLLVVTSAGAGLLLLRYPSPDAAPHRMERPEDAGITGSEKGRKEVLL